MEHPVQPRDGEQPHDPRRGIGEDETSARRAGTSMGADEHPQTGDVDHVELSTVDDDVFGRRGVNGYLQGVSDVTRGGDIDPRR